jgi:uncharacterized protein YqhQ
LYKIGGRAHAHGITFQSDIARVYASDNGSDKEKVFSARTRRIKAALRKVPLLRAFPAFGKTGTIIFVVLAALLLIEIFVPEAQYFELYMPDIVFYVMLAAFAVFILLAAALLHDRTRRLLQYHGAEHMALGTYQKGKALTAENISQQDRANPNCGSIFTLIALILFLPLMFVPYADYLVPIAFCIAFELTLLARRKEWLRWLLKFGMGAQRKIFTRQPDPAQLETARRGLTALIGIMDRETKSFSGR